MEEAVKIYEAWDELYEWLQRRRKDITTADVLKKMEELEMKHE